jgi:hypothetical protein
MLACLWAYCQCWYDGPHRVFVPRVQAWIAEFEAELGGVFCPAAGVRHHRVHIWEELAKSRKDERDASDGRVVGQVENSGDLVHSDLPAPETGARRGCSAA